MKKYGIYAISFAFMALAFTACKAPDGIRSEANTDVPASYTANEDTASIELAAWKAIYTDPWLCALIDTALSNNQELNIMLQEIEVARNEARARQGEYLPFLDVKAGGGTEKVGRYTSQGANDANTEISPGIETPEPLGDLSIGAYATWEIDVWKKLRNARKSAVMRYLGTIEGKNFMVTNLISEIANSYYELLALDNELAIVNRNIEIQTDAFEIVKLQKQAARVTELAVKRFEAQVLKTRGLKYEILQEIIETENRINFLVGRFPQPVLRNPDGFAELMPQDIQSGIPSQLLQNRPDIREAEMNMASAKLDVKVARAKFFPTIGITAGIGYQAFDPKYLIKTPQSLMYSIAGDLAAPLINRKAIKAEYYSANARQMQAIFTYEQAILKAYIEVVNQMARVGNLRQSFDLKTQEVAALTQSIDISNDLFKSARADYMEVLLTQRDALESRFELIEIKMQQMNAMVNIYKALGGGWK
ncbi:MAG: efflux transporter outer membrane subunit [Flavobacteriales bacterium]|nr:efflux transporter outer membrane subunit [Flavobacteriales bacterium]